MEQIRNMIFNRVLKRNMPSAHPLIRHYVHSGKYLLIRPLNSFKRHILHTDLGSKKQRALDYSAASTYDHRQRHVISPWYAPELSNR